MVKEIVFKVKSAWNKLKALFDLDKAWDWTGKHHFILKYPLRTIIVFMWIIVMLKDVIVEISITGDIEGDDYGGNEL